MTTINARVIADSIANGCPRLTTFLCRFPHAILPQVLTHRVFSRNTSSSRAIPIERLIADVEADPYVPIEWRYAADRGMQPGELMSAKDLRLASFNWDEALTSALRCAGALSQIGVAKEHANRLLEPFSHVNMVITATDWDNWNALRLDDHAQIEIRMLAQAMVKAISTSTPRTLNFGEWHLPFVADDERERPDAPLLSAARCARTSYLTHDGKQPSVAADLRLAAGLIKNGHWSPLEHQARAGACGLFAGNFSGGWAQQRHLLSASQTPADAHQPTQAVTAPGKYRERLTTAEDRG